MSDSLKAKMEENPPGIDIYHRQRLLNSAKGVLSESEISRRNKKLKLILVIVAILVSLLYVFLTIILKYILVLVS